MLPICCPLGIRGGLACCQQLPALSASHDNAKANSNGAGVGDGGISEGEHHLQQQANVMCKAETPPESGLTALHLQGKSELY